MELSRCDVAHTSLTSSPLSPLMDPSLPQPHLMLTLSLRTVSASSVFSLPKMLIVFRALAILSVSWWVSSLYFQLWLPSPISVPYVQIVAGHFYVDANFFETVHPLTWQAPCLFLFSLRLEKSNHQRSKLLIFLSSLLLLLTESYHSFPPLQSLPSVSFFSLCIHYILLM